MVVFNSEAANNVLVTTMQPVTSWSFHCELCNISCNAKDMLEKHKLGKKHLKIVQKITYSSVMTPPMVPPPVASETVVNETESKMHKLLQNGAAPETLLYCDICNVICNSQEGFQKHVATKKHSAKSIVRAITNAFSNATSDPSSSSRKKTDPFKCEICKITCTSNELLEMHIAGKKHLKKLQDLGQIPNLPLTLVASQDTPPTNPMVNPESNDGKTVNLDGGKFVCELCGVTCDTDEVLKIHMSGKKHLKKLKDSGQIPNLPSTPTASQDTPPTNEGKTFSLHEAKAVCALCGITCDTNEVLKIHIIGKKHLKNLVKSGKLILPNPTPTTEPVVEPKVIGPMPEEGNSVISDLNNRKTKSDGTDEDGEAKKRKVLQCGAASHLAGQKHVAMAVKQAETQARATGQES